MADPATYRPAAGEIPTDPGVYRFRDEHGRVVYVGKARNLRSRLSSYFADPSGLHPRTRSMVTTAASVDWVVVGTEVEALALEYSWIKQYDPRFNVKYRDDKSYPYLAITVGETFPRAAVVREAKRKGTRYFGPYAHAWAIRDTLDQLVRVFPIRTCRDGVFRRAAQVGRPCLLGYIDKCSAPCVGRIEADDYRALVEDLCSFLAGQSETYVRSVERQMREASERQEYEDAARYRDRLGALTRALEKNAVVFDDSTDADVIGIAEDELQMGVQVFHVRAGRIRGERGFVVEKAEDLSTSGYLERVLQRLYAESDVTAPPKEVLLSAPARRRPAVERLAERDARGQGRRPDAAARRQACPHGYCRHERREHPAAPHRSPIRGHHDPQPGAEGAAGRARAARAAAADRVHRHLDAAGPGHRGLPRRVRGRTAAQAGLPLVHHPDGGGRRHGCRGGGGQPQVPGA